MKKLPLIIVLLLLVVGGYFLYQNLQPNSTAPIVTEPESLVKKIDLTTQPEWVQKLEVTAKKGRSANGLENVTVTAKGMPKNLVNSVTYIIQYKTTNKGTQGALSSTPIDVKGSTSFTKVIDLGTCSTKSCVRHDGVTAVELELDFTTTDNSSPIWSGSLNLQ